MTHGSLAAIHIHPVKACRRIEVVEAEISATGLVGDREWQVVDADGRALTQRTQPILASAQPEIIPGGIRLSAPGGGSVDVERPSAADRTVLALLGDEVRAGDAGDDAASWFTALTGEECRLVAVTPDTHRTIPQVPQQPLTFVDAGPVLVVNTASLRDLQARAKEPFGMDRFRPNLIVETDEPWVEDTWKSFSVGDAKLIGLLPWPRCSVPQVDQDTTKRTKEPAVVLRAHRWCETALSAFPNIRPEPRPLFGIGAAIEPTGATIRVGDELVVNSTTEPLLAPPAPVEP